MRKGPICRGVKVLMKQGEDSLVWCGVDVRGSVPEMVSVR